MFVCSKLHIFKHHPMILYVSHSNEHICLTEGGNPNALYTLINQRKNWKDAQKYCRSKHMDLASVRNQTENNTISQTAGNKEVWIGLFKGWKWSDQTNSVFTFWRTGIPDNSQGYEDCAVTWRDHEGKWGDRKCTEKHPFFCYESELVFNHFNSHFQPFFRFECIIQIPVL